MREIVKENFERLKGQFNSLTGGGSSGGELKPIMMKPQRREASPRARTANDVQAFQQEATRLHRDVANLETAIEDVTKAGAVGQKQGQPSVGMVRLQQVDRFSTELNDLSNCLSDLRCKCIITDRYKMTFFSSI